jgi:riboflavin kinase/FMN adenylyltransferase
LSESKTFSFFNDSVDFTSCVISIGNFDACHLGHQELIKNNRRLGEVYGCPNLVLSFDPHPQHFLHPDTLSQSIFTRERKTRALKELGVTQHIVLTFNKQLYHMEYNQFYKDFLLGVLRTRAITVGDNFHFGFQRKGTSQWLKNQGEHDNIVVDVIPSVFINKEPISSTRIRKLLTERGNVEEAKRLLGHTFSIEGKTTKGAQVGRQLGFPTLNLEVGNQILPKDGVYSGFVWIEKLSPDKEAPIIHIDTKKLFRAVFSLGNKPTLNQNVSKTYVEAHILDLFEYAQDLYNWKACFYFENRLRDMLVFKNKEGLIQQIRQDVEKALRSFR